MSNQNQSNGNSINNPNPPDYFSSQWSSPNNPSAIKEAATITALVNNGGASYQPPVIPYRPQMSFSFMGNYPNTYPNLTAINTSLLAPTPVPIPVPPPRANTAPMMVPMTTVGSGTFGSWPPTRPYNLETTSTSTTMSPRVDIIDSHELTHTPESLPRPLSRHSPGSPRIHPTSNLSRTSTTRTARALRQNKRSQSPHHLRSPKPNKRRRSSLPTDEESGDAEESHADGEDSHGEGDGEGEVPEGVERDGIIWGMKVEDYRSLNARERKRVRNRISARTFRAKRKEHLNSLEHTLETKDSQIKRANAEANRLRQEVKELKKRLSKYEQ
ncbi:hypothetical protein M231_01366 [Tremella mesenterica]|uniref:BZIP domain-containing protein n=1 Tax=Tremella mesenterica TaxID=5217 RepID=A0A4Q1BT85_TREME|nr:hypothetical protein M231_01366 [Tremella mesenterica]